jgi:hypothetical protein
LEAQTDEPKTGTDDVETIVAVQGARLHIPVHAIQGLHIAIGPWVSAMNIYCIGAHFVKNIYVYRITAVGMLSLLAAAASAHGPQLTTSAAVSGASTSGVVGGSIGKGFISAHVTNSSSAAAAANGKLSDGWSTSQSAIRGISSGPAGFAGTASGAAVFKAKGASR